MKFVLFISMLFLFVGLSLQLPKLINCPPDYVLPSSVANSCGRYTCDGRNKISGVGCSTRFCQPGKLLGHREADNSKTYPDCCARPICEED